MRCCIEMRWFRTRVGWGELTCEKFIRRRISTANEAHTIVIQLVDERDEAASVVAALWRQAEIH